MKNVMKKLFSLLLVGVIAVSMFSFVAPNSVDAKEAKPSRGTVYVYQNAMWSTFRNAKYFVYFYNASGNKISSHSVHLYVKKGAHFPIPLEAKTVTIEVQSAMLGGISWETVVNHKFELVENSESLEGSISVTGHGSGFGPYTAQNSTGCWKYAGQIPLPKRPHNPLT